ncbi:MAG: hypothetical protein ACJ8LL_08205 [Candidatus Udaeobacter sp.]
MALFDTLVPMLRSHYPDLHFTGPSSQPPQITIPASHPDVGDVVLQDDEEEITAYLGHFTHRHFSNYDDVPTSEKEKVIAKDVVRFLDDLFTDRIVMWGSHRGMGGSHSIDSPSLLSLARKKYVWSGPRST